MLKIVNVKETLAEGLIRLTKKKDISKITVQDILDECNTSRRTFYNHFQDKYELMNWIYKTETDKILKSFEVSKSWRECVISMYKVVENRKEFYMNISSFEGQNSFVDFLYNYTFDYLSTYVSSNYGKEIMTEEFRYGIEYHCHGLVNTAIQWVKNGMPVPAEVMAKRHYENMPPMLRNYMEGEV